MMNLKIGDKEFNVQFAYEPTLKGRLISKLAKMEKEAKNTEENLLKVEDMMLLLPEILLIGLQKFHRDEFGYNYDNNEGKDEQLSKVFGMIDDYFDDETSDLLELYNGLTEEMMKNSFLSSLFNKEMEKK